MKISESQENIASATKLPRSQKFFYGIGHVLNDLCASCWFSYVLIFMTKIVGLEEVNAGVVLLIGQVADAICTMIIGYLCDRTNLPCYGKRKFWHLIGTVSVIIGFPFVFNLCIGCEEASSDMKMIYYSAFVILFQFGWASTENSHLALLPEISTKQSETVELNAIRSGLTFASGIFVYGVAWILLGSTGGTHVTKELSEQFMMLSFIVIGVGILFSIIFHIGTKEKKGKTNNAESVDEESQNNDVTATNPETTEVTSQKTWKNWLKTSALYKCAALYMVTRLGINVFQSYFTLYLTDTLNFDKEAIAYFPLIVLVAASCTSVLLKFVTKRIGGQITYMIGSTLIIGSSVWLYSATREHRNSVYGAAWMAGSGSSIILVTALTKTAELIGTNKKSGAFVYAVMSFVDKISTGVVIFIIQEFKPIPSESGDCMTCGLFSKVVQSVIPGACALLGLLIVLFLFPSDLKMCNKNAKTNDKEISETEVIDEVNQAYEAEDIEQKKNTIA